LARVANVCTVTTALRDRGAERVVSRCGSRAVEHLGWGAWWARGGRADGCGAQRLVANRAL